MEIPHRENIGGLTPRFKDNILYFGSSDHKFYAVTTEGKLFWRFDTHGEIWCSCVIKDGIVYIGSYDCHLYALDAKTGKELFRFNTSSSVQSTYELRQQTVFEFKAPQVEVSDEEEKDKYSITTTATEVDSEYTFKSEYVFKSEYRQEGEYK